MLHDGLCPSLPAAIGGAFVLGAQFVACLYIWAGRHRRAGGRAPDRDDPRVVRERFLRVGVASALALPVVLLAAALPGRAVECVPPQPLWRWFGLASPNVLPAALLPLALTLLLFLGPLVMGWLDRDRHTPLREKLSRSTRSVEQRLILTRNLGVGPLAEEWVFRACMCPLLHGAGLGEGANVFASAAIFGLAHVHHRFDADTNWLAVAVQFTYTSLFGAYSSYLFLRTGLLYGPWLAHVFCNIMGLPDFGGVPGHRHASLLKAAFVLGLGGFVALVTLDALYRPRLFGSMFWAES